MKKESIILIARYKRWLERQDWQKIIKDNDCKFIRPSKEEQCPNYKNMGAVYGDGGCYW